MATMKKKSQKNKNKRSSLRPVLFLIELILIGLIAAAGFLGYIIIER